MQARSHPNSDTKVVVVVVVDTAGAVVGAIDCLYSNPQEAIVPVPVALVVVQTNSDVAADAEAHPEGCHKSTGVATGVAEVESDLREPIHTNTGHGAAAAVGENWGNNFPRQDGSLVLTRRLSLVSLMVTARWAGGPMNVVKLIRLAQVG